VGGGLQPQSRGGGGWEEREGGGKAVREKMHKIKRRESSSVRRSVARFPGCPTLPYYPALFLDCLRCACTYQQDALRLLGIVFCSASRRTVVAYTRIHPANLLAMAGFNRSVRRRCIPSAAPPAGFVRAAPGVRACTALVGETAGAGEANPLAEGFTAGDVDSGQLARVGAAAAAAAVAAETGGPAEVRGDADDHGEASRVRARADEATLDAHVLSSSSTGLCDASPALLSAPTPVVGATPEAGGPAPAKREPGRAGTAEAGRRTRRGAEGRGRKASARSGERD